LGRFVSMYVLLWRKPLYLDCMAWNQLGLDNACLIDVGSREIVTFKTLCLLILAFEFVSIK